MPANDTTHNGAVSISVNLDHFRAVMPDLRHERAMERGSIMLASAISRAATGVNIPVGGLLWNDAATDTTWFSAKPEASRKPAFRGVQRAAMRELVETGQIIDRDPCFKCGTRADIGCKHRGIGE